VELGAPSHALADVQRLYLAALGRGQRRAATEIALRSQRDGADLATIYQAVLQPSLYEVGRRWERNEITVADEHLITAIVQFTMAQLYAAQEPVAPVRGPAVVTGVEGDLHQIGAHMVADLLEHDGWDVRFLGSNLPAAGIVAAVADHQAALVGVSATMLVNLPQVQLLLQALRAAGGPALRVMVGGAAFRYVPDAWRGLGADAIGLDGADAVQVARRLATA
jgi:methanogenic corrinoid protein MtbC1